MSERKENKNHKSDEEVHARLTTNTTFADETLLFENLYPERRGNVRKRNWLKTAFGLEGKENLEKIKCERNTYWCLRNSPLVKILLAALNSSGCKFDFRRHISCETCYGKVSGGYDSELNQVVICQNVAKRKSTVQGVLTHELIHMFDYCQNKLDLQDINHLACSEIRAANLAHCSFLSAWIYRNASPFNIKKKHKECVRQKALSSVLSIKNISKAEALQIIDLVFQKCYFDLEPIGRRCRRNSIDMNLAFLEAPLYGYDY
ncbi:mitochondrial inner membrane protease ATP23 homolog [Copidosoma floridanum]|uniref:mitochondrial inner membrane protease ATP23 homolog n=1 Tax=Copidosoma floridanum TaxID=29053 RepID=UPI000C6F86F5|nr:mitochondrial inner membrane protease ATP23 homolog [Copidosoma floridanum]